MLNIQTGCQCFTSDIFDKILSTKHHNSTSSISLYLFVFWQTESARELYKYSVSVSVQSLRYTCTGGSYLGQQGLKLEY